MKQSHKGNRSSFGRKGPSEQQRPALPVWKKLIFAVVACAAFFGVVELALALFGVRPVSYERDPYVGFSSQLPLFVRDTESKDPSGMVTAKNKQRFFNVQRFSTQKPAGTYRIFSLGGSTTYGHPYDDRVSFSGWMRAMLPVADPTRKWEVINCGGVSYASYRIAMLMEELIRYQPDLFVIYNGENEFLEQRTYQGVIGTPRVVRGAGAVLSRTRFYSALSAAAEKARAHKKKTTASQTLPGEVETMLDRVVGPEAYHRDEQLQKQVLEHYRFNLGRMVEIAHSVGAEVIFVTPASNLRDCAPFKNENRAGITQTAYAKWQELMRTAVTAQNAGKWDEVVSATDAALLIDDRFAAVHFLRGRALWELKRFDEARAAFIRARDEDVCPLRGLTPVRAIVNEIAAERRVAVVDFAGMMDQLSDHGIPGNDWFLDHVHPTIEGNRRLALAILERLSKTGTAHLADTWGETPATQIKQRVESQLSPKNHGIALCTAAKVLAWAGKDDEAFSLSRRALQLAPNDAAVEFEVGKNAEHIGLTDLALFHLRKAIEINPRFVEARGLLGNALASSGQVDEAIGQYREALRLKPDYAEMHCNLATFLDRRGQTNEAIAEFRKAIRLAPDYAEAHCNLGWTLKRLRQFDEALSEFREATRLKPGLTSATAGTAWILATHPNSQTRDPLRGIKLAEKLADLSHYSAWADLDTLAAAYASAGRYDDAVRIGQKAVELANAAKGGDLSGVNERLQLYQQQKPFIEAPASRIGEYRLSKMVRAAGVEPATPTV